MWVIGMLSKNEKFKFICRREPSGHIIFSDNSYCGDGILTALYIIGILEKEKKLSDLCELLFKKLLKSY